MEIIPTLSGQIVPTCDIPALLFLWRHRTLPFDFRLFHPSNSPCVFPFPLRWVQCLSSHFLFETVPRPCLYFQDVHPCTCMSASPPSIGKSHPHPLSLTHSSTGRLPHPLVPGCVFPFARGCGCVWRRGLSLSPFHTPGCVCTSTGCV